MLEHGIDVSHYVISKVLDHHLRPVHRQQPLLYKEFQTDTLKQVYTNNYGVGFEIVEKSTAHLVYRSKSSDTKAILVDYQTVFPLLKKGDIINDYPVDLTFYLNLQNGDIEGVIFISK